MIYETDTDRVLVWNGAAWYANWNTAWGVVALGQTTTSTANVSVETLSVTSSSFTAVANRYYKCTYYEPAFLGNSGTINFLHMRIRLTNISGAIQAESFPIMDNTSGRNYGIVSVVKTFSAGSIVLCGTFLPTGGGNGQMFHDATRVGQIIVEDIGPA
jgi:hypothetical protein